MVTNTVSNASSWTNEEDKAFENALGMYGNVNQWEYISAAIPGKSVEDIILHYRTLIDDVTAIESGIVPVPNYASSPQNSHNCASGVLINTGGRKEGSRNKARPWTKEEHSLFVQGLEIHGKSDWRSISRNHVLTRTTKQVASHAQKYYQHIKSEKPKKTASIFDITSVDIGSSSAKDTELLSTKKLSDVDCIISKSHPLQIPFTTEQNSEVSVGPTAEEDPDEKIIELALADKMGSGKISGTDGFELSSELDFSGLTFLDNLIPTNFSGDLSKEIPQTPEFQVQVPVNTSTQEIIVDVHEPNSVMEGVTYTAYGMFIPNPPVKQGIS